MALPEHPLPPEFFIDIDRASPIPLYHQISVKLEKAIHDGVLPAGARLENEISLGQRFNLSRPTLRKAIEALVDKGLLVRRRGIGTQVVHGQVTRSVELTSLFEDLQRTNQKPSTRVIRHEIGDADEQIAETLNVEVGAPVLHIRRLRLAEATPLAVLDNTLPTDFTDISREELETYGLYQVLRTRGVTMRIAKQRIGARQATHEESELLQLPRGSAVLSMSRTAFDNSGRAVEFGQHCYSPDLYQFEITLVDR